MVEVPLVIPPLPQSHVEQGERLIGKLDRSNLAVKAAFWFFFADSGEWRLVLVSPRVSADGPLRLYRIIERELRRLGQIEPPLPLQKVALYDIADPFVVEWYGVLKTERSRLWFENCIFNNLHVHAALVYRVDLPTKAPRHVAALSAS